MTFVPVTDLKQADKLWEAGLLWYKAKYEKTYVADTTNTFADRDGYLPSNCTQCMCAILVEE